MSRSCPLCRGGVKLQALQAGDVEIDTCLSCHGMWFDAGELELFPNRPSAELFLANARHAPSRCRNGHLVGRAHARCAGCDGEPLGCPACGDRLACVRTEVCAVDVCTGCRGIWLDAREFEQLEGYAPATETSARETSSGSWEIPAAAPAPARDAWQAPGHAAPIHPTRGEFGSSTHPFSCVHCGTRMNAATAYAFDGNVYCALCRPEGAVSGQSLPTDLKFDRLGRIFRLLGLRVRRSWLAP